MVLLAALQFLLHRLTGTHDILVGSPIAGRNQEETHGLIGCFLNTLVLRTDLSGDLTGRDLLKRVREVVLKAYENQDVPFERILAEVHPVRDPSRTPIFQVMLNMHSFDDQTLPLPELSVTGVNSAENNSLFDMTLYFQESANAIGAMLAYNADLFTAERMKEFMQQFQCVLEQMSSEPDQPLESFSLVTPSARSYLPDPQQPLDAKWEGPVWDSLKRHALQRGEAIAIASPGETWTYQNLEIRSNQLAHHLQGQGVGAQEVVAIYAARRPELVLALLGILKAGAAFMILDPAYPSARSLAMLQIARPCGLIHLEEAGPLPGEIDAWAARVPCRVRLPAFAAADIDSEALWGSIPITAPGVKVQPNDLAYVTFTSGSTGTPKCLQGTHRPLSHFMRWYTQSLQLTAADRVTMFSGLAHDPLLRDVFTPLWIGGTLCIPNEEALASGRVGDWMNEQEITLLHLTPPLADVLSAGRDPSKGACTALRYAVFGGDSLRPVHLDSIKQLAPQASCVNAYGATETPQIMSWYEVPADFSSHVEQVPIGQGIDGVQVLVLNNAGKLAGIGELGEIHIRTPYLTRGYVNDEALTSARFLPNPFREEAGDRMYRTGDMGRLSPDGRIEFVGRRDSQVKIRGFRIEVGEVEAALGRHPAVRDVVVVPGEDGQGERYLVAYLATDEDGAPSISEVRGFLQQKLPEYMIPSAFVFLDTLPRTPNGKVDYRALPEPDLERSRLETQFVAPRTQVEKVLAKIWGEVLGLEGVGVHDNFFDLGGQSLLAVHLFARMQKILGKDLPLTTLFQAPTIGQLASIIQQEGLTTPWSSLVPIQTGGLRPPFFCVHGCSGRVLHFYDLARSLGPEQPFYGLSALGSEKGQVPLARIEEMAAHYINAIRSVQVNGPYVIGASGFGCGIVLEMAHQLEAQGQTVKLLALMSPSPLKPKRSSTIYSKYRKYLKVYYRLVVVHLKARPFLPALYNAFSNRVLWHFRILHRFMPVEIYRWRLFMVVFSKARRNYEPKAYQGRITCFLHDDFPRIPKKGIGDWYDLAVNEPDVRFVPGNIFSMWEKPHVQTLADQLKASLDEALTDSVSRQPQLDRINSGR
jgi:amino acid adenylation domain-containing protein